MKNTTAYMVEPGTMYYKEIPYPAPGPEDVVVQLACCGICGSDVHYYQHGRVGDYIVSGEFTLGHEVAGTVVEVGSAVRTLQVGDRVALEPGVGCGRCEICKSGRTL